ncbi:PD-(D/E)XK nuclease family protein [Verrucomicrobium sp. 3C]|uniref:PD-(D/E)XK nuclease family protein n=1 Tax=Verrucomicrobium sp. 3C TaxID=1134055 RepID=UPI0018C9556B|nr:PD-(D/E)XK nuclease family protein [Verrucomicrobium sp. 3C]
MLIPNDYSSAMRPERTFLGWNQPLPALAAEWLLDRAGGCGCLDLSRWLLIVPTRQSGRTLRGALCLRRPEGFLAPRVVTPMELYGEGRSAAGKAAGPTARLWVWIQLLLSEEGGGENALFPREAFQPDFAWALRVAKSLCEAQDILSEGALSFARVREEGSHPEPELWLRLARLEERYRAILADGGLLDWMETRLEILRVASWNFDVDRVALVGCPDPHPLAVRLLERILRDEVCSVLIQAPEEVADGFDGWGRPDPAFWRRREMPFLPNTRIYAEEGALTSRAADLVAANRSWDAVTIGVCDSRLLPFLRLTLEERNISAFDPGGISASGSEWASLLADLRELLRQRNLASFRRLLCHPAAAGWLGLQQIGTERSFLLERLDRAASRTLAQDFQSAARQEPGLEPFVERAQRFLSEAEAEPLAAIRRLLEESFDGKGDAGSQRLLCEELELALEEMEALRSSAKRRLDAAEYLDLLIERICQQHLPEERPEEAVELRGWLELLWDDAPHLVLAGFQEGAVPEAIAHDFLLPSSFRERLGLRTNAQREARDAYLFEAIATQRSERGRIDVLAARFSREGEPLFPSRLLFRCPAAVLPERVRQVLDVRNAPQRHQPASTDSFPLVIGPLRWEGEKRISVTALRDYLACPFFFFLRRARRWEEFERLPEELNAREFGLLLHDVLADFGRADEMRECNQSEAIEAFLRDALRRELQQRFPEGTPPAVALQSRAIQGRLAAFSRMQAKEVRQGWKTLLVEAPFELRIGDWQLDGRIDRIDRDSEGRIRLVDFKSSERALNPEAAHLVASGKGQGPAAALFLWKGREFRWRDLQLPLYAAAWRLREASCPELRVAYLVLPKEREKAGVVEWQSWTRELEREAESCAARILQAVEEGRFWPPERSAEWDREPWRFWFDGRPAEIVAAAPGPLG